MGMFILVFGEKSYKASRGEGISELQVLWKRVRIMHLSSCLEPRTALFSFHLYLPYKYLLSCSTDN